MSDIAAAHIASPKTLRQAHVQGATLFADRTEMIKAIASRAPKGGCIAEVGVAFGDFSRLLLDELQPSKFDAFDIFTMHHIPIIWGRTSVETFGAKTHKQFYADRFRHEIAKGQVELFEGDSSPQMMRRPDQCYDLIYIDGAHDYEGVRRDAKTALPKIKSTGLLVFNDYIMYDHRLSAPYGIVQVVNELCLEEGWRITHFALQQELFCDVALSKSRHQE